MIDQAFDSQSPVMWSLTNASGDQLKCEMQRTEAGLHLRFRLNAGIVRLSPPLDGSSVDSWSRIWRAYYLTSGWSDTGAAPRPHRPRTAGTPAPPVGGAEQADVPARLDRVALTTQAILRCWTVSAADGSVVACELVRTKAGLEVRCDTSPVRARLVQSMAEGIALANAWKSVYETAASRSSEARRGSSHSAG